MMLKYCLNLVAHDPVICWFLFEVLCCLAKTFARMVPKHNIRMRERKLCRFGRPFVETPRRSGSSKQQSRLNESLQERPPQEREQQLCQEEDQLEEGEVEAANGCCREESGVQPVVVDEKEEEATSHMRAHTPGCNINGSSSNGTRTYGEKALLTCICGGRGCGDGAVKQLQLEGFAVGMMPCPVHEEEPMTAAPWKEPVRPVQLDYDALVLQGLEEDPVLKNTE